MENNKQKATASPEVKLGLDSLLKADEKLLRDEKENIEFQIAEREKIKLKNIKFLEWQRERLEELINRTECLTYGVMGANEVRNKLTTQLVEVELKKGEEYVNAFRDIQRLEEQKRKLTREAGEDEGWLKY